jgi:hypothetical protein
LGEVHHSARPLPRADLDWISTDPAQAGAMNRWTPDELAAVVAAAHVDSLVAEVETYLGTVDAFDAEGLAPFRAARERAALARELAPAA